MRFGDFGQTVRFLAYWEQLSPLKNDENRGNAGDMGVLSLGDHGLCKGDSVLCVIHSEKVGACERF